MDVSQSLSLGTLAQFPWAYAKPIYGVRNEDHARAGKAGHPSPSGAGHCYCQALRVSSMKTGLVLSSQVIAHSNVPQGLVSSLLSQRPISSSFHSQKCPTLENKVHGHHPMQSPFYQVVGGALFPSTVEWAAIYSNGNTHVFWIHICLPCRKQSNGIIFQQHVQVITILSHFALTLTKEIILL